MSYIPPELAHDPIEITHLGSIICSCSLLMMGAILMNTVPAMIITSASRGVPRITSAPKRARSYLGVMLVAISTKQHDKPKWKGHIEFFLPHRNSPCTVVSRMLCLTASSIDPVPRVAETGSFALLSHQFMRFFFFDFLVGTKDFPAIRAKVRSEERRVGKVRGSTWSTDA